MRSRMAVGKSIHLFLVILSSASVISHSYAPQTAGRRLFGGYRIVPKPCQPTIPARLKSSEPTICMFNYECSRLNGQVVGACMDGFLFGACCQLPAKNLASSSDQSIAYTDEIFNVHEIDHVPDIPILLNSDGTPLGMAVPQESTMKTEAPGTSNHLNTGGTSYTKISTFDAPSTTIKPTSGVWQIMDSIQNAEKPQLPTQADVSHLVEDFSTLLGQQNVLDDLSLPGLLSHSDSNNDIQNHQDNPAANPITTLLSPDQILQIADPVDQLPALFSQGLGQSNHTSADTILLNENGSLLNETNNPDDLFKPNAESSTEKRETSESASTTQKPRATESVTITENKTEHDTTHESTSTTQWVKFPDQSASTVHDAPSPSFSDQTFDTSSMTKLPVVTQMYANTQRLTTAAFPLKTEVDDFKKVSTIEERVSTKNVEAVSFANEKTTTPMTTASDLNLVRVPTITYDAPTGNKKHDTEDKEEVAINHIISILNETKPGSGTTIQTPNSSINKWVSIDETSKPTLVRISTRPPPVPSPTTAQSFPYTFYKPIQTTNYQNYETVPTETTYASFSTANSHSSRPSTQTTFSGTGISEYTSAKITTTNPPAPTVIVLGPLETEFTVETTPKSVTKKPITETAGPTAGSIRPHPLTTRKPSVSTTITHNISTVISNTATSNVVSTSFFSVNVKDGTTSKPLVNSSLSTEPVVDETKPEDTLEFLTRRPTTWSTLSTWSNKPTFHLKPSTPPIKYPEESLTPDNPIVFKDPSPSTTVEVKATTAVPHCDEETAAPDDLINFPPVRNPNLNISTPISQQEKPTIMETFNNTGYPDIEILSENDIPTPTFIENDVLSNKVDTFVNKIVQSLQGNFQDLKDIVYNRANTTTAAPSTATKRPATTTKRPVRKPTSTAKPSFTTTKKPVTTRRPINRPTSSKPSVSEKPVRPAKPTTLKPKPTTVPSVTTRKPQVTTKRTRPTRRPITTLATSTEAIVVEQEEESSTSIAAETTAGQPPTSSTDFRSQCGIRPLIKTGRIVGGKAASFGEWPWQVLVREATWLGLFTKNKCGGVLITDKYVITAAHCQPGFLATLVAVFGEFDLSGELEEKRSVTRNVRRVIVNRGYNPTTFESDLALLELESPVQFDVHIVPICMPENAMDLTGRMATVTGWGRLKYNGGVPSILQEVQVPIIKNSVCQEMFQTGGHSKLILDSFLCAGYANGQKDSCEGDSGGPLVMQRPDGRWFLVGTVSHGITCAAPYLPGVYMRTTYFKPWLHSITGV